MTRTDHAAAVLARLREVIPRPETELRYESPYQLAVAVALSAQCTDTRVNATTPAFFERFPDIQSLARATSEEVYPLIKSITYPNSKAGRLVTMARQVMERHGGELPKTHPELEALEGIGRKTANVLSAELYQEPYIAVDTHVHRVANRVGLAGARNRAQTERQLEEVIPPAERPDAHHLLILHGRRTCKARNPLCSDCVLTSLCAFFLGKSPISDGGAD